MATKTMLTIGADPNFKDEYGYTPLIESVRHNNAGILKMLLSAGAEPHIRIKVSDGQEYSALDFACEWNRKLVTEILVNEGVRIENPQNETILKNCGELIKKQHNKELK
ncbi:MAG: ankyrin repeat domain-containing protein [Desulfobacterales bacterium]|nr:ankyrin repeat domain-containing protein [Desulfobacterales bacterium]